MANETAIDIAIQDTKSRLKKAQFDAQIARNTAETLQDQLNRLEAVRDMSLKSEQHRKELEKKDANHRDAVAYMMGEYTGDCEPTL